MANSEPLLHITMIMLIGYIGLGKLGMPCAEATVDKGYHVNG